MRLRISNYFSLKNKFNIPRSKTAPLVIVERFFSESPSRMLIFPKYGLKNFEVKDLVEKRLEERDSIQGRLFDSRMLFKYHN